MNMYENLFFDKLIRGTLKRNKPHPNKEFYLNYNSIITTLLTLLKLIEINVRVIKFNFYTYILLIETSMRI